MLLWPVLTVCAIPQL